MNNTLTLEKTITKQSSAQFKNNPYGHTHACAWQKAPIAKIIKGLASYADDYAKRYDSKLGDDYVLGEYWIEMIKATRGLLNGELDGLDGGFTDSILLELATNNGFDVSEF